MSYGVFQSSCQWTCQIHRRWTCPDPFDRTKLLLKKMFLPSCWRRLGHSRCYFWLCYTKFSLRQYWQLSPPILRWLTSYIPGGGNFEKSTCPVKRNRKPERRLQRFSAGIPGSSSARHQSLMSRQNFASLTSSSLTASLKCVLATDTFIGSLMNLPYQ